MWLSVFVLSIAILLMLLGLGLMIDASFRIEKMHRFSNRPKRG